MDDSRKNPSLEQAKEWLELPETPEMAEMLFQADPMDLVMETFNPFATGEMPLLSHESGKLVALAKCAEVFRRPVRKKEAWEGKEARQGYRADGAILARELGMDSFDNVTGFVDTARGPQVLVDGEYVAPEDFLQRNDIVFVHVGTRERLGMVGFVRHDMNWCLPGPSLAVIRPWGVNPIWLYYFLRSPASWQEPVKQAEEQYRKKLERVRSKPGQEKKPPVSSLMFLRISDVRRITFMPPSKMEVANIREMDAGILEKARQMRQITDDILEDQEHIQLYLNSNSDFP